MSRDRVVIVEFGKTGQCELRDNLVLLELRNKSQYLLKIGQF